MKELCGAIGIVFRRTPELEFLVLHRVLNWHGWEFPKGRIDSGEQSEQTVLREISEETGLLKLRIVKKLGLQVNYRIGKLLRTNDVFLVEAGFGQQVILQTSVKEHDQFKWVSSEQAGKLLTFEDLRNVLETALKELSEN